MPSTFKLNLENLDACSIEDPVKLHFQPHKVNTVKTHRCQRVSEMPTLAAKLANPPSSSVAKIRIHHKLRVRMHPDVYSKCK